MEKLGRGAFRRRGGRKKAAEVEDEVDTTEADALIADAMRDDDAPRRPRRRDRSFTHFCPVCKAGRYCAKDVEDHLRERPDVGFSVGDSVECRARPSLRGVVVSIAPDHGTMEVRLPGGTARYAPLFRTEAFRKLEQTSGIQRRPAARAAG